MRDIGRNITTLRKKRGMTQDALAEALHVTRQTVSNYENGRSRPDIDMLEAIAQVLDTDINTVLYGLPVPKNKKRDYVRLVVGGGIFAVLLIAYCVLDPICQQIRITRFDFGPSYILVLLLRPVWMLVLGWVMVQGVAAVTNVSPVTYHWVKYVRWGLLALLAAMVLLILPFILWLVEGMIESAGQDVISRSYQHFWLDYYVMNMLMKQPWVMSMLGAALWLFGFPERKK